MANYKKKSIECMCGDMSARTHVMKPEGREKELKKDKKEAKQERNSAKA